MDKREVVQELRDPPQKCWDSLKEEGSRPLAPVKNAKDPQNLKAPFNLSKRL